MTSSVMDDFEWLATRHGHCALDGRVPVQADEARRAGIVVEPTHVAAAARLGVDVIAVVGWPTGRHHSVIKAAEARLAAESGAAEVWLAVDPCLEEQAVLADVIAVRQAVSAPTRFGVIAAGAHALGAAELVGADALVVGPGEGVPDTQVSVSVCGLDIDGAGVLDAVIAALEAGAQRVFSNGLIVAS